MPNVADDEWVGTKVLYENERVRVWDFQLEPGESTKLHTHRRDWMYVYVTEDNSLRIPTPRRRRQGGGSRVQRNSCGRKSWGDLGTQRRRDSRLLEQPGSVGGGNN